MFPKDLSLHTCTTPNLKKSKKMRHIALLPTKFTCFIYKNEHPTLPFNVNILNASFWVYFHHCHYPQIPSQTIQR